MKNAYSLQQTALGATAHSYAAALALAQVGQEELGKTFLLLLAFAFEKEADWIEFWRRWRKHNNKAYMAHLYEWVCPLRVSLAGPNGQELDGVLTRPRMSDEKEVGLYVDFDPVANAFVEPASAVAPAEAVHRIGMMGSLGLTAATVHDVLNASDPEFRFGEMSKHLNPLWHDFQPQDAMLRMLAELATRSPAHGAMVEELRVGFTSNEEMLTETIGHLRQAFTSSADESPGA